MFSMIVLIRTRPAQLIFAVTALSCYSENELSGSGPSPYVSFSFKTFYINLYKYFNVCSTKNSRMFFEILF